MGGGLEGPTTRCIKGSIEGVERKENVARTNLGYHVRNGSGPLSSKLSEIFGGKTIGTFRTFVLVQSK